MMSFSMRSFAVVASSSDGTGDNGAIRRHRALDVLFLDFTGIDNGPHVRARRRRNTVGTGGQRRTDNRGRQGWPQDTKTHTRITEIDFWKSIIVDWGLRLTIG